MLGGRAWMGWRVARGLIRGAGCRLGTPGWCEEGERLEGRGVRWEGEEWGLSGGGEVCLSGVRGRGGVGARGPIGVLGRGWG